MLIKSVKSLLPSFDSYRGRYAYFAALVGVVLLAFAYLGWNLVNTSTQTQISNIISRTLAAGVLADAQTQLNQIENQLQRILIDPVKNDLDDIRHTLEQLEQVLDDLARSLERLPFGRADTAYDLLEDRQLLQRKAQQLIEARRDNQDWFPAMKLMLEDMYPHNQRMLGELQILLQEVESELPLDEKVDVIIEVSSLQRLWLGMTGELRLMVANRFGLFSANLDFQAEDRYGTIFDYAHRFNDRLRTLQNQFDWKGPYFVISDTLRKMEISYVAWMNDFKRVRQFMDRPTWRMDLHFMREQVTPLFERMRQSLSIVDLDLDTQSAEDITRLTQTAKQLSTSILVMALMGLLMLIFAYQFIKRNLLQPIAQTARALKLEASGALWKPRVFLRVMLVCWYVDEFSMFR